MVSKDELLTACRVEFKKNGLISVQFNKDIEGLSVKQLQKAFDMMWREYRHKMKEKIQERHRKQREEKKAQEEIEAAKQEKRMKEALAAERKELARRQKQLEEKQARIDEEANKSGAKATGTKTD